MIFQLSNAHQFKLNRYVFPTDYQIVLPDNDYWNIHDKKAWYSRHKAIATCFYVSHLEMAILVCFHTLYESR